MSSRPILVVDDDESIRGLLTSVLAEELDVPILEAADGEEAVRLALEFCPPVVLLDLMLPKMDGYGVAGHLRADPRTRDCCVIANSAGGDPGRALASGANEFLAKPFDLDTLVARVRAALAAAPAPAAPGEGGEEPIAVGRRSDERTWSERSVFDVRRRAGSVPAAGPDRRRVRPRDWSARIVLGSPCPICGRQVRRLGDHMLGASPCRNDTSRWRQPARGQPVGRLPSRLASPDRRLRRP